MRDPAPANPRFSVVIPTCRRNDALARCLDQLKEGVQTLPASAYEVIVSDDGLEGVNARSLVRDHYPGVRWVAGPARGPAANRNRGAAEARGAWLAFTDDDCLPQPGWLAAFAARLGEPDGSALRVLEGTTTPGEQENFGPFLSSPVNREGGLLWSCNFAIERRLFEEMGGFDDQFPYPHLEDVDLRLRLQDRGQAFPFVREAVVEHPPRPGHPVPRWVRVQESSYYLARKRGVPVSEFGQSIMTYLRMGARSWRASRNAREAVVSTSQIGAGMLLNALYWPWWSWKYRGPHPVPPEDHAPR